VATGEITTSVVPSRDLEVGEAMMANGRLSIARRVEPERPRLPFSPSQLSRLDEALTLSSRSTGLEFAIYLGDLGDQSRQRAEDLHANLGARAAVGVLLAVSPGQRQIELVTGEEAHRRIPDRSCQLAVMSMVASFKEGDLTEGLISALRMLSDTAGTHHGQ
jgi:uncharacterized membrane protein YgcG